MAYLLKIPSSAPYTDGSAVLSELVAFVNTLVIRVCTLFVGVLNILQICAIKREAKSRRAQWLSISGLIHNCLLTTQVTTEGMISCN